MPKAKARRKSGGVPRGQVSRTATAAARNTTITEGAIVSRRAVVRPRRAASTGASGVQGMVMPALVALGCWGMAFSFAVFSTDANHLLFAGMAALMAIMWSVSCGVRLRKMLQRR